MKIFETERLIVKSLEIADKAFFAELFTNRKILELIPQKPFTEYQIRDRFNKNLNLELSDLNKRKCTCGVFEKGNSKMVGLALFLINENNEKELGYRFRTDYWRKGYGTELIKGMLEYYFNKMNTEKVTADVNIANVASVKILERFMEPVIEFFNERDNCTDRRYELEKNNWLQHRVL